MAGFRRNSIGLKFLSVLLFFCVVYDSEVWGGKLYTLKQAEGDFFLMEMDTANFESRDVGRLMTDFNAAGLAWDPVSESLYMTNSSDNYLWKIDTETGRADMIGEYDAQWYDHDFTGLAYDCKNRILWATDYRGAFYAINPSDASLERIVIDPGSLFSNEGMHALAYNYRQDALVAFQPFSWLQPDSGTGMLFKLDWRTGGGKSILAEISGPTVAHGIAYDPDLNLYWGVNGAGELFSLDPLRNFEKKVHRTGMGRLDGLDYAHTDECEQRPFQINFGLNDAWFDPLAPGQGFFIDVFPLTQRMFIGWFTFDLPDHLDSWPVLLGAPEHRWLTAQGAYSGDTGNLTLYLTGDGLFNATLPIAGSSVYGEFDIQFERCDRATVNFSVPSAGLSDQISISRVNNQRVQLCKKLEFQTPEVAVGQNRSEFDR